LNWHDIQEGPRALRKLLFPAFLLLCFSLNIYGQQVRTDSLNLDCDQDLIDLPVDSTDEQDFVPADLMFIPSDVLYDKSWNNMDVRSKCIDPTVMEDTILLILNHPSETPFVFP